MNFVPNSVLKSRGIWLALAVALLVMIWSPVALAQEPTLDEINAVARELYCPLCNGVRLDTCDLLACIQMREVIADKLAAGVAKEQIKQEFVAQYGPVVLGEPPRQGLNLLAWVLPVAALVLGAGWLLYTTRRWTRQASPALAAQAQGAASSGSSTSGDPYLTQVEADLADLDS